MKSLTLTFTPDGRYACPGLGSTRDLAVRELDLDPRLEQRGCSDCPVFSTCRMSHWTQMEVEISDVPALQTAAEELGCSWQISGHARGWNGKRMEGDFVLRTPSPCPYDIAAKRHPQTGKIALTTDWYQGHVERVVGPNYGRLLQHYGIAKAHAAARAKGYTTTRKVAANGNLVLTVQMP